MDVSSSSCTLDVPSVSKLFPMIPPESWLVHLAARLVCLASVHITQATVVSNGHAHLDCNGYFCTVQRTHTLQTDSTRPPNIPHQQASTLNVAPHCLLECWEVYMDIITTLPATLTTSEADPVDLLTNTPQQIKEDEKERRNWSNLDSKHFSGSC
ncbi:hypothetical protein EYF80_039153 [Scomber scombrus]|uniref:Uncharacterized protein n=1 Tax=Scomber scombrus TaxID=13677 RepID=A0AAV1NU32_SCOSC